MIQRRPSRFAAACCAIALALPCAAPSAGCVNTEKMQAEIDQTKDRITVIEKLVARLIGNDAKAAAAAAEALRQMKMAHDAGREE